MKSKMDWPSTLKPILMAQIDERIAEAAPEETMTWGELAGQAMRDEIRERVALLLAHFGMAWPKDEDGWLAAIFEVGRRADVPGFRFAGRGPGASQKWTEERNRQLFADVMLMARGGMSEHAACVYISKNAPKFLNRYPRAKAKTLHRQFLRAKAAFEKYRHAGLEREKAIQRNIDLYSADAEKELPHRIAQK